MSSRNWWTTKVFNKKAQWTEKHLQQRVMITTDSRVEAVIITMGGVDANIVTEGKDPEVEAVIVRGGTVPVLLVGDLGQEIGDRGPGTGVQKTEDPGQGQGDGHVHPEEDRGIGNVTAPADLPPPLPPPQAVPVQAPGPEVGPGPDPDLGEDANQTRCPLFSLSTTPAQ